MAEETGHFGMFEKEASFGAQTELAAGADTELLTLLRSDFGIDDPPEIGQLQPTHLLIKKYEMSYYLEVDNAEASTDYITHEVWMTMSKGQDRATAIDVSTILAEQVTDEEEHQLLLRKLGFVQASALPIEIASGSFSTFVKAGFLQRKGTFKKAIPVDLRESQGVSIKVRNPSVDADQTVSWNARVWLRVWGTLWDSNMAARRKSRRRR